MTTFARVRQGSLATLIEKDYADCLCRKIVKVSLSWLTKALFDTPGRVGPMILRTSRVLFWAFLFTRSGSVSVCRSGDYDLLTARSHGWSRPGIAALMLAPALSPAGCSRSHYYCQADREASQIVAEKSCDPRWPLPPGFTVNQDPRSRYYDPCDQVFPPMPQDDPASNRLMACVDGMKGFRHWHDHGDRQQLDNPEWRARLGQCVELNEQGAVKLSLPAAVRLAYVNSPSYQSQLETLYLSALDVSTERFRFDVQFFGTNNTTFTTTGPLNANGEASTLETDTSFNMQRNLAAGGEFLAGIANSIVWQFAGPQSFSDISILNFSLLQPLLRNAGRAVALEELTIVERALLANLRALRLYREGLYAQIAIGDGNNAYLQRRGGFFGGTGMSGFTGTGIGGFGNVGGYFFGGGAGNFFGGSSGSSSGLVGGGAAALGGFIGMLQTLQAIRNSEVDMDLKLQALGLLEAHLQAGTINLIQVDQFRQSIQTQRANLLQNRNSLQTGIENFEINTLGLPPDVPVELDDSFIRPFQFITPAISRLQKRIRRFPHRVWPAADQAQHRSPRAILPAAGRAARATRTAGGHRGWRPAEPRRPHGRPPQDDDARRGAVVPPRRRRACGSMLGQSRQHVQQADARITELRGQLTEATRRQTADRLVQLVTDIARMADELSLIQARARVEAITVQPEMIDPTTALNIARANRLDWMNNRAALVDTWRLIEYNANSLAGGAERRLQRQREHGRQQPRSISAAPRAALARACNSTPPLPGSWNATITGKPSSTISNSAGN